MDKHPLGDLMEGTMRKIREMIDVNTIVGTPIQTPDGVTLIPISKVSFGFTAGGGEYTSKNHQTGSPVQFGGGSGAGVNITPVAFLVVRGENAKIISVNQPASSSADRIIESAPEVIEKILDLFKKKKGEEQDDVE
jgi:sporulation protein YtfJ